MLRVSMGNERNDEINLNFSLECIMDHIIDLWGEENEAEIRAAVIKFCQREGDLCTGTKNLVPVHGCLKKGQ